MSLTTQRTLLPILLGLLATGCAISDGIRQYSAYDGPQRSDAEVAVLHVPWEIKVGKIDNHGRYYPLLETLTNPYRGALIDLLPGSHSIELNYHSPGFHSSKTATTVDVVFEPGEHYVVVPVFETVNFLKVVSYEIAPY